MAHKRFGPFLSAAAISFCLSFGSVGCVISGFQLSAVSLPAIAVFCLLFSLLVAAVAGSKRGMQIFFGFAAFAALMVLLYDSQGIKKLLSSLTRMYSMGYGWEQLFPDAMESEASVDVALCLIAGVTALLSGWTVRQGKSNLWALAPTLLTVSACIIVTDTVPGEWYIFLTLLGIVLLVLPQGVRRRSRAEGARLTALLLIPCLLFSGILFWTVPQEGYELKGNPVQQAVLEWLQSLPFAPKRGVGLVSGLTEDLQGTGPVENQKVKVMEVVGARDGILYLRGQAYDVYTGLQWGVADIDVKDMGWPKVDGGRVGSVKIRTVQVQPIRFFPYYIYRKDLQEDMVQGKIANPNYRDSYAFIQMDATAGEEQNIYLDAELRQVCLALPESTRKEAEALVKKITKGEKLSVLHLAERIGDYVRDSAYYSLDTKAMPEGSKDFALWFLEEGVTGYCVHFASAATVLLRAAGIPARYVTGYSIWAQKGKAVDVTAENAHAWVEYFVPGVGWKVMEPTPAAGLPQEPEIEPLPTDPPITETTEPTEEPTIPATTTRPVVGVDPTTKPTTRPNLPTQGQTGSENPGATTGNAGKEPGVDRTWLLNTLKVLAYVGGTVLVVWGQYALRIRRKRKRMYTGPMNRRALERWREARVYARVLKLQLPEELEQLAEKAKFSQHTLTAEELHTMELWLKTAREALDKHQKKLLLRLFWALT